MKNDKTKIIMIDDDEFAHLILRKNIEKFQLPVQSIHCFNGQEALLLITDLLKKDPAVGFILLLDINMPICNGWEFLELFRNLKANSTGNIQLYILSSSINPIDIEKSKNDPDVIAFLEKPLRIDKLRELINISEIKN
jgi:CheY-like chemotaxis protein